MARRVFSKLARLIYYTRIILMTIRPNGCWPFWNATWCLQASQLARVETQKISNIENSPRFSSCIIYYTIFLMMMGEWCAMGRRRAGIKLIAYACESGNICLRNEQMFILIIKMNHISYCPNKKRKKNCNIDVLVSDVLSQCVNNISRKV